MQNRHIQYIHRYTHMHAYISVYTTVDSFKHSGYFLSASSSSLLPRGASDTARILCRSFTPKRHRQLWRLERDSSPRPFGRKTSNLPMNHSALPICVNLIYVLLQ